MTFQKMGHAKWRSVMVSFFCPAPKVTHCELYEGARVLPWRIQSCHGKVMSLAMVAPSLITSGGVDRKASLVVHSHVRQAPPGLQ